MRRPPVFYTLAQTKFNRISQMDRYASEIQEYLRLNGYPDFRPIISQELIIRETEQIQPAAQYGKETSWHFLNPAGTEGYILRSDSLMFHTTLYNTFEDFSQKFFNGINIVNQNISLSFIERLGLRYLNAFAPESDDKLSDYINNSLLGFVPIENSILIQKYIESINQVNNGMLVARAMFTGSGIVIPPDLYPFVLKIQSRFEEIKNESAIIDIDYYKIQRFDFDLVLIQNELSKFHDIVTAVFENSMTSHAREILE